MEINPVAFWALAATAVAAAFGVVSASRIMHAALCLGAAFFSVAGFFLIFNAEMLAAAQVLIYVGAVTTIIIFGIMLSEVADIKGERSQPQQEAASPGDKLRRGVLPILAAGAFTLIMLAVYRRAEWPSLPGEAVADTTRAIGLQMFTEFVIPFELAAVLLLVALVGAIVMATREERK